MTAVAAIRSDRLPAWSLFAGVLSAAGLPIYIYAPKFYADSYGVSLAALGAVLFGLRLFDVVQDPALGWLSGRLGGARRRAVAIGALVLALSMIGLFAIAPPIAPLWWFGLTITGLFTAFSFLTINFYAEGIGKAEAMRGGHVRLAAWREGGALLGVCLAAIAPTLLIGATVAPFALFALLFALVTLAAALAMTPEWGRRHSAAERPARIATILSDPLARRLLLLAFLNATPLAVTSTLFLFFVESRLAAPGLEGPLLVLFFFSAAVSAPLWGALAARWGAKRVLLGAMVLSMGAFALAFGLGAGDTAAFAAICIATGAATGADLTLLPALFARRMAAVSPNGGQGFGLWSLVTKASLAVAAVVLLPTLEAAGFVSGRAEQSDAALRTLSILYALIPLALKSLAIGLLAVTRLED